VPRRPDSFAAAITARCGGRRETPSPTATATARPAPAIPRQRSVRFDDLIAEGTALLGARRNGQAEQVRTAR
jgi:hypothetical protein